LAIFGKREMRRIGADERVLKKSMKSLNGPSSAQ